MIDRIGIKLASMFNALHKLVIRHQPNPLYQTNNEIRKIPQRLGVLLAHPCKGERSTGTTVELEQGTKSFAASLS